MESNKPKVNLRRLRQDLESVMNTPVPSTNGHDNLAVLLCTYFDDGEEADEEWGWSEGTVALYELMKEAIVNQIVEVLKSHVEIE